MALVIPAGKKITITKGGGNVTGDIPMIIEEDVTISMQSSFSPLFGGEGSKILDIIGATMRDLTGGKYGGSSQFKQFGIQLWDKTEPIALQLTVSFFLGNADKFDAFTEVYQPTMRLASLTLPTLGFGSSNLIAPGPSPLALIKGNAGAQSYQISITVGRIISISNVVIKRAEPTFSMDVDDQGYPIRARVSLDIESVENAYVEMLDSSVIHNRPVVGTGSPNNNNPGDGGS